ncbi:MAG: NUDIX domain-containing protein [Candidatus Aenigmarchaeota archaeon]|nr:NUDIX domain-containing protein [Candidatus Aenigmarchaeota archaeon]
MKRKYRRFIFAVVFLRRKDPQFLILHRIKNWTGWELLKGGVKDNEKVLKCLKREIKEETGAKKFKIIGKTRHYIKYKFPKGFVKDKHIYHGAKGYVFLVELFSKKIKVDKSEHDRYLWVSKDEAMEILTHKNHKNALKYIWKHYKLS